MRACTAVSACSIQLGRLIIGARKLARDDAEGMPATVYGFPLNGFMFRAPKVVNASVTRS